MTRVDRVTFALVAAFLSLVAVRSATAQAMPRVQGSDSVTIAAGAHFRAGGLHRSLFGGVYRDLWTRPIRVPVLNLNTFAGGIRPHKSGGGLQTESLRFLARDGSEYVFRVVDKIAVEVPAMWRGTFVENIGLDNLSNSHPAASEIAAPLVQAAGLLHATPVLVAMPDDTLLGKYREKYSGKLGMIEQYPNVPKDGPGFGGAVEIIDSDTLLDLLNHEPQERIDARGFLAARLLDLFMNDWDRHQGQWKWARLRHTPDAPWEPIPRDRDHAFVSSSGLVQSIIRKTAPAVMQFSATYGSMKGYTYKSLSFDQRLLSGLEKPVWDSIARALTLRMTDPVIDAAAHAMPVEYQATAPALAATLRARRAGLAAAADRFYRFLAAVAYVHGTEVADRATVLRVDDRHVEVRLASPQGYRYYTRRFDAAETREIRIFLHGGDDRAVVVGNVNAVIPVRVIGGNGMNTLVDSTGSHSAHLYDTGTVTTVNYGADTLFNRLPMIRPFRHYLEPVRDVGGKIAPMLGLSINHDYGIMPRIGINRYTYGFDHYPYSSLVALEARYSLKVDRYKVGITVDKRFENSRLHVTGLARMSQLELFNFYGLGNSTVVATDTGFYDVHQNQWLFRPSLAYALGGSTDLSLGPVVQYAITDSLPNTFIALTSPYGFGRFGEAGFRIGLLHDNRVPARHARHGTVLDVGASYFPAVWDVRRPFEEVDALAALYLTLPLPLHPFIAFRAGGKKLFGDFPFQESAFLGGTTTIRTLDPQRYAGDASVYGTTELRIPVARFRLLSLPVNTGLLTTADIGRVYLKGNSPDGWHSAIGAGFWVGFHELTADVRVMRADEGNSARITLRTGLPEGVLR
jgi:hypothetical protein